MKIKTMYHITAQTNWQSIQNEGLVPQYGFLSDMILEQQPAVYMFLEKEEVSYAMRHWFGDMIRYVYSVEELILLEIQLPYDFEVEVRYGWEAICYYTIHPRYIRMSKMPL